MPLEYFSPRASSWAAAAPRTGREGQLRLLFILLRAAWTTARSRAGTERRTPKQAISIVSHNLIPGMFRRDPTADIARPSAEATPVHYRMWSFGCFADGLGLTDHRKGRPSCGKCDVSKGRPRALARSLPAGTWEKQRMGDEKGDDVKSIYEPPRTPANPRRIPKHSETQISKNLLWRKAK